MLSVDGFEIARQFLSVYPSTHGQILYTSKGIFHAGVFMRCIWQSRFVWIRSVLVRIEKRIGQRNRVNVFRQINVDQKPKWHFLFFARLKRLLYETKTLCFFKMTRSFLRRHTGNSLSDNTATAFVNRHKCRIHGFTRTNTNRMNHRRKFPRQSRRYRPDKFDFNPPILGDLTLGRTLSADDTSLSTDASDCTQDIVNRAQRIAESKHANDDQTTKSISHALKKNPSASRASNTASNRLARLRRATCC